jgi:hypothetical protein
VSGPDIEASDGYAIVLLGSFNPPIFHPQWFALHELLEPQEAESAEDVDVDADWCFFRTRQFGCEVSRDRLHIFSTDTTERFEPLGHLARDTFSLLRHTPVEALSMIRFKHVAPDVCKWVELAPKLADTAEWAQVLEQEPLLDRFVVRSTIPGHPPGVLGFAAEASRLAPDGAYLSVTHQYKLEQGPTSGATEATTLLNERWEQAIGRGDQIIDHALGL